MIYKALHKKLKIKQHESTNARDDLGKNVWRYQSSNQKLKFEERQTMATKTNWTNNDLQNTQ
jgi:hypothetical protein